MTRLDSPIVSPVNAKTRRPTVNAAGPEVVGRSLDILVDYHAEVRFVRLVVDIDDAVDKACRSIVSATLNRLS